MKKIHIIAPLGLAALLLATASASAQSARFSSIDRNGDGLLSYGELVETFGRAGADRLWSRGDGSDISRSDISRINQSRNDDDDDDGFDDDDDDGRFGRDDDDDDGRGRDDDDDGRERDDDDDDGRGGFGGGDDDDDDGGGGDDDDD
ncbi:MAG: hypothetical protein ACEPO2_01110 [Pelagibaca sp.]